MAEPRLTVVTPSFNQARFLPATLDSVLSQGYPGVEYIVVDGASTDGSAEIIRSYGSRLAWWVSEPDRGQADAIAKGLARARGEYVAWLNSDDVYLPGAIERAVGVLDAHPEVGLVYSNGLIIDEDGRIEHRPRSRQFTLADLLSMSILHQPTVFMRREVFVKAGGLDPTYHLLMDHHLWIRMAIASGLRYVDDYWAAARRHAAAKNSARGLDFAAEARRIQTEVEGAPATAAIIRANPRTVRAGRLLFEAGYLIGAGRSGDALLHLGRAAITDPRRAPHCAKLALLATARGAGSSWAEHVLYRIRDRILRSRYPGPDPRTGTK